MKQKNNQTINIKIKKVKKLERYRHLNTYLKEKFGERTLKIPVDGGFTCPNRDGKVGYGGCIFCTKRGSGEHLKLKPIPEQVKEHLESYRGKRANKFIVYFQNFTNTYDSIESLKEKYDSSLLDDRIVGIDIATRPDCINEDNYYKAIQIILIVMKTAQIKK